MSIRFVFGPAGSGKSTYVENYLIEESAKNPKDNYLYIVPDQFTMQTQMDIVKKHPHKGILNIDVLSFGRLSYRVFSVTGKSDYPVLDDTGKSLVLRRVAAGVRDRMPLIGKNLNKPGYISEVKSQISEFMQYGLSVKDIQSLSEKMQGNLLKRKLSDLSVIYEAFMNYNRDKFITNEETLDILVKKLPEAKFIEGATVVFDGFTGFTPIQEQVVLALSELTKEVIITFDLSLPELPTETGFEEKLFYLSRKGANRLKEKAKERGIEIKEDTVLDGKKAGRFVNKPEFSHLEANLFRYPYEKYDKELCDIEVFKTSNIEEEVSAIALKINELVRTGAYSYRDFAVITGNLESYAGTFESRMAELSMPVYIDKTNAISLNPFTEYLKSALNILIKDFSFDAVFHFLKSGFTDFTNEEIDRFERYVQSLNLRGKGAYSKPFTKRERGVRDKESAAAAVPYFEDIRKRLMERLSILQREAVTAKDYANNLYEFLKENRSYEKLLEFEALFEEENNLPKAKEYSQIYKCIMDLLDTIVSLIGDDEITLEEFYKIFEAGISEIEVGTIPKNVDRILVGDIERTRIGEVKVLFFAGVNDGNIPKATDKGGLLSQIDREALLESGYDLAPTPREEMYTQRLYLYMNLCKPTDRLFISYAGTDTEGKGLRPSYLIEVLKKIFTKLEVKTIDENPSIDSIVTMPDSLRFFSRLLRDYIDNHDEANRELTEGLLRVYRDRGYEFSEAVSDAAFTEYIAKPLSEEIVRMIYGNRISASISRMELYAGCAYAHFLRYGMGLKENKLADFDFSDLGNIYHGVLDNFSRRLEERGLTWSTLSEELGKTMVSEAVREYCEEYEQGLLQENEKSAYTIRKITKIMERTVDTLSFQAKRGKFVQEKHEYSFEREIKLKNGKTMLLNGKIDRIDVCEENGRVYVKIVDYKSGNKDIDITNVYHGLEQQLSVYMSEALHREEVINKGKEVIPSALLYYTVDNPMISDKKPLTDDEIDEKIKKELRVKGLFEASSENILNLDENNLDDGMVLPLKYKADGSFDKNSSSRVASREEFENMLGYVNRLIESIGENITTGDVRVSPMCTDKTDACKYCEFKAVCRFDEKIPGFKKRDGKEIDEEKAREIVMGGKDDGLYLFD